MWLAPVNAVMPGVGIHVFWWGLWMERAPGLSLNQLAYLGRKDLVENMIINLLQVRGGCGGVGGKEEEEGGRGGRRGRG